MSEGLVGLFHLFQVYANRHSTLCRLVLFETGGGHILSKEGDIVVQWCLISDGCEKLQQLLSA
jgi:hypothetical protein